MKKIAITGTTSGIGLETAKILHDQGNKLFLLVRNVKKMQELMSSWKDSSTITIIECDLSDLASVKKAAQELMSKTDSLDVLINNAGGVFQYRELSKDGFEMHFAMNHLGHFLLTNLIINLLKPSSRILNLSSEAHRSGKLDFDDLQLEKSFSAFKGYANAKLCNIYFTNQLHERYSNRGISSFSLHPGVVRTGFASGWKGPFSGVIQIFRIFFMSPKQGAATTLYLATSPNIEHLSGKYFKKRKPIEASSESSKQDVAAKLWEESEKMSANFM